MEAKEITQVRKQNMKIYPLYRAISCDLLFYYAIEFLFLTQVKHISSSDVVLKGAFYSIFMMILQIPISVIIDKIGTRKATILANIFNCIYIILIMCCKNLPMLIFAEFISSLCFSIKGISDSTLLQYSIPKTEKQGEIFSKIEGKGCKDYHLINAITYICSGFLYVINPYIPIMGTFIFTILSTFMSLGFREIKEEKKEKQTKQKYRKELWKGIKFIVKSQRLRSLFLYSGIAWGIFCLMGTYRASMLVDINTSEQMITFVATMVAIASGIGAKRQLQFHNYFRNKSLSVILGSITVSIFIMGMAGTINISYEITLAIIIMGSILINFMKGIYEVLITRYLGNFADKKIITQIYAVHALSKNLFRAIISFLGSYLLRIADTANSMIMIGIILLIAVLGLVNYMKTRLGLKPEDYNKNEIFR